MLRLRCANAFQISRTHCPGNDLPRNGFRAAPWAIRRGYRVPGHPLPPTITLNPERMSSVGQETFDISHSGPLTRLPVLDRVSYFSAKPFPPGTKGVLYYHQSPTLPPASGQVRFRICDTVSQFANGRDLDVVIGDPWNIPLLNVVKSAKYKGIKALLLREGLVDRRLIADIQGITKGVSSHKKGAAIFDIDQPFVADLSTSLTVRFNTRRSLRIVTFRPFTLFRRYGPPFLVRPFNGLVKARFELHQQDPVSELRLRFLEILTPITHNPFDGGGHIVEPRPGELLTRGIKHLKPWATSLTLPSECSKMIRYFLAERALEKKKYGI